ncbi:DedA family protein [Dactylosporangium sp. NPDC005572]|uniref:DedA family protein n=1 Tax=Dactylosporangium sp. NPDC005572 TaxID=3156889 RepID=UPI0033B98EF8
MEQLRRYGYPALFVLVLLEGVGIPTPAVSAVVAAAVLAGQGSFDLPLVVAVTLVAAVTGDNLGYLLGRRAGRPAILRWGRRVGLTEPRFTRAERFLTARGRNVVLFARFVDGLRQTNGLIAGAVALPWRAYVTRDAIGAVAWTAVWVTVGAVAGGNLDRVRAWLGRYELRFALTAAVLAAIALWWYLRRRRDGRDR